MQQNSLATAPFIQGVTAIIRHRTGCDLQPVLAQFQGQLNSTIGSRDLLRALEKVTRHPRFRSRLSNEIKDRAAQLTSKEVSNLLLRIAANGSSRSIAEWSNNHSLQKSISLAFEEFISGLAAPSDNCRGQTCLSGIASPNSGANARQEVQVTQTKVKLITQTYIRSTWFDLMSKSVNIELLAELLQGKNGRQREETLNKLMVAAALLADEGKFPPKDFLLWAESVLAQQNAKA